MRISGSLVFLQIKQSCHDLIFDTGIIKISPLFCSTYFLPWPDIFTFRVLYDQVVNSIIHFQGYALSYWIVCGIYKMMWRCVPLHSFHSHIFIYISTSQFFKKSGCLVKFWLMKFRDLPMYSCWTCYQYCSEICHDTIFYLTTFCLIFFFTYRPNFDFWLLHITFP
jgi:hypothetical protein